jgi:hypothetical protein
MRSNRDQHLGRARLRLTVAAGLNDRCFIPVGSFPERSTTGLRGTRYPVSGECSACIGAKRSAMCTLLGHDGAVVLQRHSTACPVDVRCVTKRATWRS